MKAINNQKLWTDADNAELRKMWEQNIPLSVMAETLGRTGSSIVAKLVQRGYVAFNATQGGFFATKPVYSMNDVVRVDKEMRS